MDESSENFGETSLNYNSIKNEPTTDDCEMSYDPLDLLQLSTSNLSTLNIEYNSTEVMPNPFNMKMCCMHCLKDLEKEEVSDHMIKDHGYRRIMLKCQICHMTFELRTDLTEHKEHCKEKPKRTKRKTLQQILKELEVKQENEADTFQSTASCPICMLELPKFYLKDHIIEIHSKPLLTLTCGICHRDFKSKFTLREHIKLVHESVEGSVSCELCGQEFRSKKYLSNHKRNVHPKGDKVHKCTHCGKVFKSHLCLHQHIKYVHPPESAMVKCDHCPKVFKSKINLHQHVKITHDGKRRKT